MFRRILTTRFTRFHQIMVVAALLVMSAVVSFAQTATPFPQIEIPMGDTITYLNNWLVIFGPFMLFIGMIPVALNLLRFLMRMFSSAFGGLGGSR